MMEELKVPSRPQSPRITDEKDLIRKRGSIKGRVTAFANYLSTLKESTLSSLEARELQLRIGKIESLYNLYDEVQLKIECIGDGDLQESERTEFENNFYHVLANAQSILDRYLKAEDKIEWTLC
ncbi:hypothetical protein ACJJTC_003032 [Scirpophaga incertulas]